VHDTNVRLHLQRAGFTLNELVVVIMVIGVLSALTLPSFYRMRERAREAVVKSNAHTVQFAAEDFSAQNAGVYATDHTTILPSGETLSDLLTTAVSNPFDPVDATPVVWTGAADAPGRVGYDGSLDPGVRYQIDGQGENGVVIVIILNGA
jgi:prepilin-type N-terminal cleavage/methylation domain-containing protein